MQTVIFDLGFFVVTQEWIYGAILSAVAAVLGLLAHNFLKMLLSGEGEGFSITLPSIQNGKLRIGGSLTNLIIAFVVGVIVFDPVAAFALGYAGADALREFLRFFESKEKEYKPL